MFLVTASSQMMQPSEDITTTRPPLNKKLFPVYCPTGPKRCEYKNLFHVLKDKIFFSFFFALYILVYEKMNQKKYKKSRPPDWHRFSPPGQQETLFYLRGALYPPPSLVVRRLEY